MNENDEFVDLDDEEVGEFADQNFETAEDQPIKQGDSNTETEQDDYTNPDRAKDLEEFQEMEIEFGEEEPAEAAN